MSQPGFFGAEQPDDGGIRGVAIGIVTDNEDPKSLGRVKLSFPWRDADDESFWARIATEMAGNEYGTYFLPEIDDEVLVAFENGDIHKPFVIGSLWNGKQKPPQKNSDGNNDVREVRSRSDHTIAFDDCDDGSITIQTSAGNEIVIDDASDSETIIVRDEQNDNSIAIDSESGSIEISADKNIDLSAKNVRITGKQAVKLSSNKKIEIDSGSQLSVSSKAQMKLNSKGMMKVGANGMLQMQGKLIKLN